MSERLLWCLLFQWLLFHFFQQQQFMKLLCMTLYFQVKTSLFLFFFFERALLSVHNVTHVTLEELFLPAEHYS